MSDTFGASDLNADTPGLGPQSGNERGPPVQLPSQLQGLVRHFFQQSQGNPNPKFLPPAPGPGGGKKTPDLGPTDPPDRDARTLAPLPANAPQPPRKFDPYMPPVPRDHDMWGKPELYPRLPHSFEVGALYQNSGNYFAQHGAAATAPLGANLVGASKEYIDGYAKGMDLRMRLAKEQVALNAQHLEDLERARSIEYADVFTRHDVEGGKDPQALHDDIWRVAVEHGDKDVIAMMDNGDSAEKVRRFLALHEAHIRALSAANKKSEDQDVDNAAWGLTPSSGGGGEPYDPYTNPRGSTEAGGGAAPTAAPSAPSGEKDAGRAPGVGDPADKTKPADPDAEPLETPIEEAGDTVVRGGEPPTGLDPNKKRAALLNGMQKNARLDQIIGEANSGKIKPEDVLPEVRKLSPSIAQELDNTMNYRAGAGATGQGSGQKEQEYRGRLASLARLAKPGDEQGIGGWNQSTYKAVADFREEAQKPNSPLQRVPTAVEAAENLRRDLKAIQDRDGSGADVSPETLGGAMGKDPLYSQLKIDWIRYNEDIDVLTRGSPSVGMAEQAINTQPQIPYFGSIEGYRGAIRRDMDQAYSRVRSYHRTWNSYRTGDAMPAYNPDAEKSMTDIGKMDYVTGAIPGEIIVHPDGSKFRYLAVNPENPKARENWETIR